jgi:hypothetical protein
VTSPSFRSPSGSLMSIAIRSVLTFTVQL